jgi:hypothetical protein
MPDGDFPGDAIMKIRRHKARLPLSGGIAVIVAIGMLAAGPAYAAGPAPVGLGTAAPFAVLAGTAVTSSGGTTITGDLGISPGTAAAVTGFPPGTVSGTTQAANPVAVQAKTDLAAAYAVAAGLPVTATHGTLGGLTLVGGVYNTGGVVLDLTGTVTLDGQNDPSSVWVFQATSSLTTASASRVALINGANPCNVFWQVTSSATLGSGSTFVGTIMALTSITMANGVTVDGRALARNGDVTLINDTINNTCSAVSGPTPTPGASITATTGATGTSAASSATPPPTSTIGDGSSSRSTPLPLFGMVLLALAGFGLVAVATRRRSTYR